MGGRKAWLIFCGRPWPANLHVRRQGPVYLLDPSCGRSTYRSLQEYVEVEAGMSEVTLDARRPFLAILPLISRNRHKSLKWTKDFQFFWTLQNFITYNSLCLESF